VNADAVVACAAQHRQRHNRKAVHAAYTWALCLASVLDKRAFLRVCNVPNSAPRLPKAQPAGLAAKSAASQAGSLPATVGVVAGGSVAGIHKTRLHPCMVHREDGQRRSSSIHTVDGNPPDTLLKIAGLFSCAVVSPNSWVTVGQPWVRLNKCTKTAIDRDESEIGRFLCSSSSKKVIDRKTMFLAEKFGCCRLHCMETV
jgi:hypothetical protein